jgi:3-oxoacyl-[acyl-carrier protein] reductase
MGIGHATAVRLKAEGALLALLDTHPDVLGVAEALGGPSGGALGVVADVGSTSAVNQAVQATLAAYGQIDGLVANAGITRGPEGPADVINMTDSEWDAVHNVNLKGTFRLARACLPSMIERRRGCIVCFASIMGGHQGWAAHVHYAASKAGVEGFVRALAVEVSGYGVRVVGVAPGLVETAQSLDPTSSGPEALQRIAREEIPLGYIARPEDIAPFVGYLLSDEARYANGEVYLLDGGLSVRSVNR